MPWYIPVVVGIWTALIYEIGKWAQRRQSKENKWSWSCTEKNCYSKITGTEKRLVMQLAGYHQGTVHGKI